MLVVETIDLGPTARYETSFRAVAVRFAAWGHERNIAYIVIHLNVGS